MQPTPAPATQSGTSKPSFVTLSCPSCGSRLQITPDLDRFACSYCGNEHIVHRAGGIVTLAPVVEGLRRVQTGVDKTAAELAVARLTKEIDDLEGRIEQIEADAYADLNRRLHLLRQPLFIGICLVTTLLGAQSTRMGAVGGLFIGFVLAAVSYLLIKGYWQANLRGRLAAQIDPLDDRIEERHVLLAKNRQIAEG